MKAVSLLVFTDLDGSLLDHYSYSHSAATTALKKLDELHIPLIANTSKTRVELEKFRRSINNHHPFICENGAAVNIPKYYFNKPPAGCHNQGDYWQRSFVEPRVTWQEKIAAIEKPFHGMFRTFQQMSIAEVMVATGLEETDAQLAMQREFGEPVQWLDKSSLGGDRQSQFIAALVAGGAQVLKGGRFIHVSGACDKGRSLTWLAQYYSDVRHPGAAVKTVALGDSNNDTAMLEAADYAVIVKSPCHDFPLINKQDNIIYTEKTGPAGWAEAIEHILESL
jgi:mannosyl-3-phosphoglycerate phosphatase family protein